MVWAYSPLSGIVVGTRNLSAKMRWLLVAVIGVTLVGGAAQFVLQPVVPRAYVERYAPLPQYSHALQEVMRTSGPILSQDLAPVLDAGKEPEVVDLRGFRLRAQRGELSELAVLDGLRAQRYQLVLLTETVDDPSLSSLSADMRAALQTNYLRWSETNYAVLYRPVSFLEAP